MKKVVVPYEKGYVLEYLFTPGNWMNNLEKEKLINDLRSVNVMSGMNLGYAIFNPKSDATDFLNRTIICIMRKNGEAHGFFFSYIVSDLIPFIHQGLIVIGKNEGIDLFNVPYKMQNYLIREYLKKDYFTSNITATPKGIGIFCDLFSDVWPSPYVDQSRCPFNMYRELLKYLHDEYIKKFFPYPELTTVNTSRFVLRSSVKEMGFEVNFHEMARDHRFEINVFTHFWIQHQAEEDIIQIARFDLETQRRQSEMISKWILGSELT